MKTLVLSGGRLKGAAFAGALRALEEAGARFDAVGGSSAGAVIAAFAGAGMNAAEIETLLREISAVPAPRFRDYNLRGALSLLTFSPRGFQGLLHGDRLESQLSRMLAVRGVVRFQDLVRPTFVVTVNALDGRELVCTNLPRCDLEEGCHTRDLAVATALRASTSIPGVFAPKRVLGGVYVDGGVRMHLPLLAAQRLGADEILGITFAERPQTEPQVLGGGMASLLARTVDLMMWDQVQNDLALLQGRGVIPGIVTLDVADPPLFELRRIPQMIDAGYAAMKQALARDPDIIAPFLA